MKQSTIGSRSGELPCALTFYLTRQERSAVLRTLGARGPQRAQALLRALAIKPAAAAKGAR